MKWLAQDAASNRLCGAGRVEIDGSSAATNAQGDALLVIRLLVKIGDFAASYVFQVLMLLLVVSDPIMRYVVGQPFVWSHDLSALLMVMMGYFGFAAVFAKDEHLSVTLLSNLLPGKTRDMVSAAVSLVTSLFIGLLTYLFILEAHASFLMRTRTFQGDFLLFPWQAGAVLGLVLLLLTSIGYSARRMSVLFSHRQPGDETGELKHLLKMQPESGDGTSCG